ncbi:DUF1849 family protein [Xanthobacter sp. V4C-4]|uniref:EipB family protein n=1 Tax=Xanthobacter cornucopiae TaxID=3119924 RepID=UPI003727D91D
MRLRSGAEALAGAGVGLAMLLGLCGPASALALLPHRASYALTLDGSRPTGQLEDMSGRIDYQMTGDACAGYSTLTRQASESRGGEGGPLRQTVTSKAWEAGDGESYRFLSTTETATDTDEVEASVTRPGPDRLKVVVTKPADQVLTLEGAILMPTQHVLKVLDAAAAGAGTLAAKVYDGASDPDKVYDTLAVIGRPRSGGARLAPAAEAALAGHLSYPVAVSYYEPGSMDEGPAYVMNFTLYDNGVVGALKIDYGRFALIGSMSSFEALPGGDCKP